MDYWSVGFLLFNAFKSTQKTTKLPVCFISCKYTMMVFCITFSIHIILIFCASCLHNQIVLFCCWIWNIYILLYMISGFGVALVNTRITSRKTRSTLYSYPVFWCSPTSLLIKAITNLLWWLYYTSATKSNHHFLCIYAFSGSNNTDTTDV